MTHFTLLNTELAELDNKILELEQQKIKVLETKREIERSEELKKSLQIKHIESPKDNNNTQILPHHSTKQLYKSCVYFKCLKKIHDPGETHCQKHQGKLLKEQKGLVGPRSNWCNYMLTCRMPLHVDADSKYAYNACIKHKDMQYKIGGFIGKYTCCEVRKCYSKAVALNLRELPVCDAHRNCNKYEKSNWDLSEWGTETID